MDRRIGRWMDRRIGRWMDRRIGRWMDRRIGGWMDRRIGRWMDRRRQEIKPTLSCQVPDFLELFKIETSPFLQGENPTRAGTIPAAR